MIEIEVKFYLPSVPLIRKAISGLPGVVNHGRVFEKNIRFETRENRLRKEGILLRLRRDEKNLLTLKTKVKDPDPSFKMHHEFEVSVSDFDTTRAILERLGFYTAQVYEKWRETFSYKSSKLLIDALPYGDFLEIEGDRNLIQDITKELGLDWDRRITTNYLAMFDIIKKNEGLAFHDITFENFRDVSLDVEQYVPLFEVRE
ncbi:MAG: class IV adenylate cyclase [Pseudomonadota bacterium]